MSLEFGYYPHPIDVRATNVSIRPSDIEETIARVTESELVADRWYYAPPQYVRGFGTSSIAARPYSARVFGLPTTHRLEHAGNDPGRLRFLMHCFGFFEGMRFDDTGAGFLDATPIERGTLNDFALVGTDLSRAIDLADAFWDRHATRPEIATTLLGVFQSLALAQRPQSLAFEEFIYAYTALEGCFAVGRVTHNVPNNGGHAARTANLCNVLGVPVPAWLPSGGGQCRHRA